MEKCTATKVSVGFLCLGNMVKDVKADWVGVKNSNSWAGVR